MHTATVLVYERGGVSSPEHTQLCLGTGTLNLNFALLIFMCAIHRNKWARTDFGPWIDLPLSFILSTAHPGYVLEAEKRT